MMTLAAVLTAGVAVMLAACADSRPRPELPADADAGPRVVDAAGPADAELAPTLAIQYADPDHGPFRGNTEVVIRGSGFRDDDEVLIGGRQVLAKEYIDSRRWRVITPAGEPGDATIEVRRTGERVYRADGFTYEAIAVDPPAGSVAGGTFVTITGLGTDFAPGTTVAFDGVPLVDVDIGNGQRLTGYTPPGTAGDANVEVTTATTTYQAGRAYTYQTTGDPFAGGFSGGPLAGTLNVVVVDAWTKDGIPDAYVAVGDPATTAYQGRTDVLGQITFSGADLVGPVTVTTSAAEHEVASFHCFDAANVTIFLRSPLPPPDTGPGGVGASSARIRGHVMFGDATGLGSPYWTLVPEPRTATEVKRIYVTTTHPSVFTSAWPPLAAIDYAYDADRLAWPFEIETRAGAWGVVALAGLYDPARDSIGDGVEGFEPFAFGVARGVLVGPGDDHRDVDVVVDVPLDGAMRVELVDAPALGVPGQRGPTEYLLKGFVDLGGEGTIGFGRHGLPARANDPLSNLLTFAAGASAATVTRVPPLIGRVGDGSYAFVVGAYTDGSTPFSVRVIRDIDASATAAPLRLGEFLAVPRFVDPLPEGVASGRRVEVAIEGPATTPATFHMQLLSAGNGDPIWRGITCGDQLAVELPDLTAANLPWLADAPWPPVEQSLLWTSWRFTTAGPYDQFTYRWLGSSYWRAYAADTAWVAFPAAAAPPSP